ncbi:unnamed protein product [Alternaria alternata]
MPAFTLYGSRGSTNTDRVRLTLAEGGFTDYELVLVDLQKGEQKVTSPMGKVPAVTFPSGFALYESRAICKYLARKYSFPLVPQVGSSTDDIEAAALFDQAESTELLYFADPAGKIAFEMFVKKKYAGQAPNEAVVSDALRSLEAFLDVADRLLQDRDYMAGNGFSLADINYIPSMQRLFVCGYGDVIRSRKAVSAWWDRCVTRPAIQKILAADKEAAVLR